MATRRQNVKHVSLLIGLIGLLASIWFGSNGFAAPTPPPIQTYVTHLAPTSGLLTLITEPDDGLTPLLTQIKNATSSVDLVMYELQDPAVEQALVDDATRGLTVRVLLDKGYYGSDASKNQAAYAYLTAKGVDVHWTPTFFALTHQKTLVTDPSTSSGRAVIMTFNLTPQYYETSRDFGLIDADQNDVAAIESTFNADWQNQKLTAPVGDDLVWSPGSEPTMIDLINQAESGLMVYNEEMGDAKVTSALEAAAKRGVDVEIDMTYQTSWKSAFAALVAAGAKVKTYASSAKRYIHAKMILADGTKAFVGSENFSATSLNKNRELGLIITDQKILASLTKTFISDWAEARSYTP